MIIVRLMFPKMITTSCVNLFLLVDRMHLEIKWFEFSSQVPIQFLVFTDKDVLDFFLQFADKVIST